MLRVTIPWVAAVAALVGLAIVLLNAAGLLPPRVRPRAGRRGKNVPNDAF